MVASGVVDLANKLGSSAPIPTRTLPPTWGLDSLTMRLVVQFSCTFHVGIDEQPQHRHTWAV
jgi:hypothetical protein